jgi:hypothetical protein
VKIALRFGFGLRLLRIGKMGFVPACLLARPLPLLATLGLLGFASARCCAAFAILLVLGGIHRVGLGRNASISCFNRCSTSPIRP